MPCICYGAMSGKDAYDEFIRSEKGKETMEYLTKAAAILRKHRLPLETIHRCNDIEFRQMFVKAFLHMLVGCDEEGKPKAVKD